jgi:hypothetical protein
MNKFILILFFFCLISPSFAQEESNTFPERDGNFTSITGGLSISPLRDKGTSPLLYTGVLGVFGLDFVSYKNQNLWQVRFTTPDGVYVRATEDDLFSTTGFNFDFRASYERNFESKNEKRRQYLGAMIDNWSSFRTNSSFMNAGFAFNNISSLNLTYALEYDLTRKAVERKILGFINYKRKEKHYFLRAQAGLPLFAMMYQPGYTHVGNATVNDNALFTDFEWNTYAFPGLSTEISITRLMKNGNQWRYSYHWNAFTTGEASVNRVDMANHMFLFTLIVKLD